MDWSSFDKKYAYSGKLGAHYRSDETIFRVWAPVCEETGVEKVEFVSYGKDNSPSAAPKAFYQMKLGVNKSPNQHTVNTIAVWELTLEGNQLGLVYTYRVTYSDGSMVDTQDPYSIATIVNGRRSVVAEIPKENLGKCSWRLQSPTDAVIEEIHVRDFSISDTSGVSEQWRGKYLGLVEEDTSNLYRDVSGFDYLISIGINAVQLMPVFDFSSVDERRKDGYNWGYDPQNYNVPEGSYATNPFDPMCRVNELKTAIRKFHASDFNVIMDVVYNHVFDRADSCFEKLVPGYYFRKSDATGCGNDTASEREMFSKFIVDSATYWAETYGFDGFRFDLMGCIDVTTMNVVREALDKLDSRLLIYGEGWDMPTDLPENRRANQRNLGKMPRIGAFNDAIRNIIRGSVFEQIEFGFVDGLARRESLQKGEKSLESRLASAMKGSRSSFRSLITPEQMINYVEAHDNLNLNDQLWKNHPKDSPDQHSRRIELASGLNLLAQGVPFMEIGQEFERTKLVSDNWTAAENSYNAGDFVNEVDWNFTTTHKNTLDFVKKVIDIRLTQPVFRLNDYKEINSAVKIQSAVANSGLLILTLVPGNSEKFKLVVNASGKPINMHCSEAEVLLTNSRTDHSAGDMVSGNIKLSDLSLTLFSVKGRIYAVD
ncbi:MAG: type I pullulanase [Streptococcaceae bacterium]|jgi:pullulanase|nr:type I pullulanase [Streptococcaceae bacterium]